VKPVSFPPFSGKGRKAFLLSFRGPFPPHVLVTRSASYRKVVFRLNSPTPTQSLLLSLFPFNKKVVVIVGTREKVRKEAFAPSLFGDLEG